jgi:hypothetical protein
MYIMSSNENLAPRATPREVCSFTVGSLRPIARFLRRLCLSPKLQ